MKANLLLETLSHDVDNIIRIVETDFSDLPTDNLNWKENSQSWSILECIEHLNRYSRYYHSEIKKALNAAASIDNEEATSTWLGNKFINMMSPKNLKKQKTLKHLNPSNSKLEVTVIAEFLQHQQTLKMLLQKTAKQSLNKTKVRVEFFKLLKINLGDAFQFLIAHEQRHMIQLQNILLKLNHTGEPTLKV